MNRSLVDTLQLFVSATPPQSLGSWRLLERHFMDWDESAFRDFVPVCVAGWEGVPDRLVANAEEVALNPRLGLASEATRLAEATGLTDDASWTAVASWACALAITTFNDALDAMPKPAQRDASRGTGAQGLSDPGDHNEAAHASADNARDDTLLSQQELSLKIRSLEQGNSQLLAELTAVRDAGFAQQPAALEPESDQCRSLPSFDQPVDATTLAHFQEVVSLLDYQMRETHRITAISNVSAADYRARLGIGNRSRGSVGNAQLLTGSASSGVAWDQAGAGRSWGTARPAMLAVQTPAR